jgi:porin
MIASSGDRANYSAKVYVWLGFSVASACIGGHVAHAADLTLPGGWTSPTPAPVPWLFGDWDGARTRLSNAGIDFQFGYTSEIAGNATGGQRRDVAYTTNGPLARPSISQSSVS